MSDSPVYDTMTQPVFTELRVAYQDDDLMSWIDEWYCEPMADYRMKAGTWDMQSVPPVRKIFAVQPVAMPEGYEHLTAADEILLLGDL
jgi:hypothetical protein